MVFFNNSVVLFLHLYLSKTMSSGRFLVIRKLDFFVCLAGALPKAGDASLLAESQNFKKGLCHSTRHSILYNRTYSYLFPIFQHDIMYCIIIGHICISFQFFSTIIFSFSIALIPIDRSLIHLSILGAMTSTDYSSLQVIANAGDKDSNFLLGCKLVIAAQLG